LRPCGTPRIDAPCVLDGPINGERFKVYIAQFLVPTHKPGDMVIMDNLVSHKGYAVRRAIRRREASVPAALQFLTSTIQQVFAKLKTLLRNVAEPSVEANWLARRRPTQLLHTQECANLHPKRRICCHLNGKCFYPANGR